MDDARLEYAYRDGAGVERYRVVRVETPKGKIIWQERPAQDGSWIRNTDGVKPLLYRLPELMAARCRDERTWVLIPEGEKKVDHLRDLGFVATCNSGGAMKWPKAFDRDVFFAARVAVLADNDEPGRRHARLVAQRITEECRPERVVVIQFPDTGPAGDVLDWLDAGHTADELIEQIDHAPCVDDELTLDMDTATATLSEIQWLWRPWLPRGFVTCVAAVDGFGKSKLALHIMCCTLGKIMTWPDGTPVDYQRDQACKVLYFPTEAQQGLDRQRMAHLGILDRVKVLNHRLIPKLADQDVADLTFEDDEVRALLRSATMRLRPELVVVDSLFGAHGREENSSKEMAPTMQFVRELARDSGACVLVTQLARKARENEDFGLLTLDRIRGTTGIRQFCRSIIGIERPDPSKPDDYRVRQLKNNATALASPIGMQHLSDAELAFGPAPQDPAHRPTQAQQAAEALRNYLETHGPAPVADVKAALEAQGFGWTAVKRGKELLHIVSKPVGRKGGGVAAWQWALPGADDERAEEEVERRDGAAAPAEDL